MQIYELAVAPSDDPENTYADTDFYFRPGNTAKKVYHTALLFTCRRVWLEANSLPLRAACPTFYFKDEERRPRWAARRYEEERKEAEPLQSVRGVGRIRSTGERLIDEETRFAKFMAKLTTHNLQNLKEVQFFTQMYWLERQDFRRIFKNGVYDVQWPQTVRFTVKHTDWWYWEEDQPLHMKTAWLPALLENEKFDGASVFKLELETLSWKVKQLLPIIEELKSAEFAKWHLDASSGEQIMKWYGPSVIGYTDHTYGHVGTMVYVVHELIWRRRGGK